MSILKYMQNVNIKMENFGIRYAQKFIIKNNQ